MKDLSLHVLDIAQNSIAAEAKVIQITLYFNRGNDYFELVVKDNGKGMEKDFLLRVTDPFTTTRITRKVGLGIPLLKRNAELTGGSFSIYSEPGAGTILTARFIPSHIDCLPLGDLAGTFALLICSYPKINFIIEIIVEKTRFCISTKEIVEAIEGVPLSNSSVYPLVKEFFNTNLEGLQITNLG